MSQDISAKVGAGSYRLAYLNQRFKCTADLAYATPKFRAWLQEQGETIPKPEDAACLDQSRDIQIS
jgi:hypothetical protein